MKVYHAINAVAAQLARDGIGKTRSNTQQNYKFRGIDEVMNALAPLLASHKLIIFPRMVGRQCEPRQTKGGGILYSVTVEVEFDFVSAEDGSKHTARTFGEAMDSGDKATNKAASAAYKYAAFQTFCIPLEGSGDTDADASTPEETRPFAEPAAQEPPARPSTSERASAAVEPPPGHYVQPQKTAPVDRQRQVLDKPQSGRVATNLIAKCELRMAAVMKGSGDLAALKEAHEGWKLDARECWHEMTGIDQRRAKQAREKLEAAFAEADAAAARAAKKVAAA